MSGSHVAMRIGHVNESITLCIILESQTHSVNDSIYNFDRVFLEIPVENCMVGMLLTYTIDPNLWESLWCLLAG